MSYPRAHGSSGEEELACAAFEISKRRNIVNISEALKNSNDAETATTNHNYSLNLINFSKDLMDKVAT